MRRKVLQDFATALCQKFIDLPNGDDLASFVEFGSGTYDLDILNGDSTHNGRPIAPLRICGEYREWLLNQQTKHGVPPGILRVGMRISALISDIRAKTSYGHVFRSAHFNFECHSEIQTDEKTYSGHKRGAKIWGLPATRVDSQPPAVR